MIKDVKTYFQTVANRLSNAFMIGSFDTEQELEFWSLAAEHMSREDIPKFSDVVQWMDVLYQAPIHFIYKKEQDNKLRLYRRRVLTDNILHRTDIDEENMNRKQEQMVRDFEDQLQNLQERIEHREDFLTIGITSHAIGKCEHIPIFAEGEFRGIYCAGPYVKSPEAITSKLSIVGRILSDWLVKHEQKNRPPQKEYEERAREVVGNLGTGRLNITGIATLFLEYLSVVTNADTGIIIEFEDQKLKYLAKHGMSDQTEAFLEEKTKSGEISDVDTLRQTLESGRDQTSESGIDNFKIIKLREKTGPPGFLLLGYTDEPEPINEEVIRAIANFLADMLDYRRQNEQISDRLMDTYLLMLRTIEKSRDKTYYHTPRLVALVDKFADAFGLDDLEKRKVLLTAKLHDIGYVGTMQLGGGRVGAELEHPLVGGMMVEFLPLNRDVKEGIRTHHEWVNGSGSPKGLEGDKIPWTGKIVGVFEFITDYIESHREDESKSGEEWIQSLSKQLIDRADNQFDMVLIPTVIELIKDLGWKKCCELGTDS